MDQNQLAQYINAYRVSPHLFNDDEVDQLTKYASEAGINFNRNMEVEERKQTGMVGQFIGGLAEGFLGPLNIFGGSTNDPVNSAQQISRSMGSLIGFVPGLLGGGLKIGASVVGKAGKYALAKKTSEFMKSGASLLQSEAAKSVPIRFADWATGGKVGQGALATYGGRAGKVADSFLKGETVAGNIAQSAVHLGTASAIGEFWKGPNAMMDSFFHGAVAGGAFGTIGNYKQLIEKAIGAPSPIVRKFAESRLREGIAKGLAGSAFQGGMATMHDAPTGTQLYEYMLGAYFGSAHPSVHQKIGREYFNEYLQDGTTKNYKMKEDPKLQTLPKEAREEAIRTFDKHIGEKFQIIQDARQELHPLDRSKGSQLLRNAFNEQYYEDYYSTLGKLSRKDMTAEDRLNAQKELVASLEERSIIFQEGSRISKEILEIKPEELVGETKEVQRELNTEQLEQLKQGNFDPVYNILKQKNEFYNDFERRINAKDLLRNNLEAENQAELDSNPMLKRFARDINNQKQSQKENELSEIEVADVILKANETVKTKLGEQKERQKTETTDPVKQEYDRYELFKNEVYKELGVKPTENTDNALKQNYERFRQDKDHYQSSFDLDTGSFSEIIEYSNGVRKSIKGPTLPHSKLYGYDKPYMISEVIYNNKTLDPLAKTMKIKDGEFYWDYVLTPQDFQKLLLNVERQDKNKYIWTPEKDKGKLIVRDFHPETMNTKLKDIKLSETDKKYFKFDQYEFLKLVGAEKTKGNELKYWKQQHENMFKSNYLYDPKGQFKSALDLVKRSSLLSSKDYPLNPNKFKGFTKDDKLDVIFIDDVASAIKSPNPEKYKVIDKNGKEIEKFHESDVDGYVVLHTDLFNKIIKEMGFDKTTSHLKPTIATEIDGKLFLLKGGIHPSQKGFDAVMPSKGSMIVMTSAAKVNPGKTYTARVNKEGKYEFLNEKNESVIPESTKINFEDLRLNFGVYGDKHSLEPVSIKRQMHSTLSALNIEAKNQQAFMQIFKDSYLGMEKHNNYVEEMLRNPKMEIPKDFDITKIGHKQIAEILNGDPKNKLVKELINDIVKETSERKRSDDVTIDDVDLLNSKTYADRIQKEFQDLDYNSLAMRYLEDSSGNFNDAVLRYVTDKYLNPKYDYSASSWVAGNHALFKHSLVNNEIRKNHFMLGHSMKDMKHKGYKTLGEAWEAYKDPTLRKKEDSKSSDKQFKEDYLRIAVMRVPSPDISGTRVLYFDGFTGKKNGAYDYGTYLRQKDQFYIDGADVDGDKVFLYQGMPKEYLDGVFKERNNLELPNKKGVMRDNKAEKNNSTYDKSTKFENDYVRSKMSQYMPNALIQSGRSAKVGKDGMGNVVTAKEYLNIIFSDVIKKGGNQSLTVLDENNEPSAIIKTGPMSKENLNRANGYFTHTREASSRTADSSEAYKLLDARQMQSVLLQKGMPLAKIYKIKNGKVSKIPEKNDKGKDRFPLYEELANTAEYSELFNIKKNLYRSKGFDGKRPNLSSVQNNLKKWHNEGIDYQSSLTELSKAFGKPENEIQTNLIRPELINFDRYNRIMKAFNDGWKDPSVLKMIRRQKITVRPDFGKAIAKDKKRPVKETTLKANDIADDASILIQNKAGEKLYNDMINKKLTEEDFIEFADTIALRAFETKDSIAKTRSINPEFRKTENIKTTEQAEEQVRSDRKLFKDMAENMGINPENALIYYDMYMLGSLYPQTKTETELRKHHENLLEEMKTLPDSRRKRYEIKKQEERLDNFEKFYNKTSRHNYPYQSNEIPNSSKRIFMDTFSTVFDLAVAPNERMRKEINDISVDPIMEKATNPETPQQKDQKIKEVAQEKLPFKNLFDMKVSKNKVDAPKEAQQDAKRIVELFNKLPEHSLDNINDMFLMMIKDRDGASYGIEEATYTDLKHFKNVLEEINSYRPKGDKPSWVDRYLFPRRVAEKQFSHDFSIPFKTQINFRDATGKLGVTDVRVPMGTMQHLQKSFGGVYNLQNVVSNLAQEERDKFFSFWRKDILDMPNGVAEANMLHQAAVTRHHRNQGRNEATKEYNWFEWKENEGLYNSLKDKVYKITEKGRQVEITGEKLMKQISEANDKFLNMVYKRLGKSDIKWDLIDVYSLNGSNAETPDYKTFNKQNAFIKFDPKTARVNLEFLMDKYLRPIAEGRNTVLDQIGKNGFTSELIARMRYEYQLERFAETLPKNKRKSYRESYRQKHKLSKEEFEGGYFNNSSTFQALGEVQERYWARMFHTDTKASTEKVERFMEQKRIQLRKNLERKYIYNPTATLEERKSLSEIKIDRRYDITENEIALVKAGEETYKNLINQKIAELETSFEAQLGKSLTLDNGSGVENAEFVKSDYKTKEQAFLKGHFTKPGSGQSRGEEPMPGFSYDFKVVEAYHDQWINSFFKNATGLIAKRAIDRYRDLNPLKDAELTESWINLMKDYTTDVLGYPSLYDPKTFGLKKSEIKKHKAIIKQYKKQTKNNIKGKNYISKNVYDKSVKELENNKKFQTWDKRLFYYVTDEAGINGLDKISTKLWGRKDNPKLPFYGDLPRSPEARRMALSRILHKIGASEAKWSLVTLLSHPKTAIANIIGGSHNTIASAGVNNFVTASFNKKKLLSTIFKGTKLRDGTEITTRDHLKRFAEESGAHETFYVTEASLERKFTGKEAKEFMKEVVNRLSNDPNLSETNVREIAKKYKVTEAVTNIAAIPMRLSEKKLRTDSFFAHYMQNYNILKNYIPNIKHNDPYVINMALKGVEATQFLYHSAFRPNYSRTAIGKMMTRFHPFAWNSIRFRRTVYQRAKRYGYQPGTQSFNKFRRLATLDMFALSLANMFTSSVFDSTLPPPLNWLQDTADWLYGDERERDRAFFSSWPHPVLAPLQIVTPPIARYPMTLINATINGNWERFADYYLWTFFPFGRFGRSIAKTIETPEMWVEQMTGIPIHGIGREKRNLVESN